MAKSKPQAKAAKEQPVAPVQRGRRGSDPGVEEVRERYRLRRDLVDKVYRILRTGIYACVAIAFFKYASGAILALSGKETTVNSVISWAVNIGLNQWVAYSIAAVSTGGFLVARRNSKRVARTVGAQKSELEAIIDPGRSKSGLKPDGTPKKEHRDG